MSKQKQKTICVDNKFSPWFEMKFSCIELVIQSTICGHIVGLVDAKIRASDKDLPVHYSITVVNFSKFSSANDQH